MYTHTKIAELVTYVNSVLLGFIGCGLPLHAVSLKGVCLRSLLLHTTAYIPSLTAVHVEWYD